MIPSIIKSFLVENKAEVTRMCITEYVEARAWEQKEEGFKDGMERGRAEGRTEGKSEKPT